MAQEITQDQREAIHKTYDDATVIVAVSNRNPTAIKLDWERLSYVRKYNVALEIVTLMRKTNTAIVVDNVETVWVMISISRNRILQNELDEDAFDILRTAIAALQLSCRQDHAPLEK